MVFSPGETFTNALIVIRSFTEISENLTVRTIRLRRRPSLSDRDSESITAQAYAAIPKWILASIAAMGQESRAIEDLTDFAAVMFKLGYDQAWKDFRTKLVEMKEKGLVK